MSAAASIPFFKMNGLGNQIVVADARAGAVVVAGDQARAIAADPRTAFDQLMVIDPPRTPGTIAFVRIFNADGSEAGACGNGMRCVAMIVRDEQLSSGNAADTMTFETTGGLLPVTFPGPGVISVDMGAPRFRWDEIPLSEEFQDTTRIELQIGPIDAPVLHSPSVCNMGNPHAVFWVDDVDTQALERFGPMVENHPLFPDRANITIAKVQSPTKVRIRTWERGVGLTQACGSAACAVLACGARTDRLQRRATVTVPGGDLRLYWPEGGGILMSGPAELEFRGTIRADGSGAVTIEA